jgi:hypothetical protein
MNPVGITGLNQLLAKRDHHAIGRGITDQNDAA